MSEILELLRFNTAHHVSRMTIQPKHGIHQRYFFLLNLR